MTLRHRRRAWHGVVGAAGVVAALGGFVGGFYAPSTSVFAALAIWILGATLVNLFTDGG